jgi:hypothetical protein
MLFSKLFPNKSCCVWLDNGELFLSLYTEKFTLGDGKVWSCSDCKYGFKC